MDSVYTIKTIARIQSDFPEKFGIPRQSGLIQELKAKIIFEPEYRNPDALKGLEGYSHIWLIWGFSRPSVSTGPLQCVRPASVAIRGWGYSRPALPSVRILWDFP